MTQLTPQSTDPQTRTPARGRRAIVFGAVAVVALLVGAVLFVTVPSPGDAAGREGIHDEQSLASPEAVVAEATSVLPTYAAGADADAAAQAAADAQAQLETAARTAQSAVVHEATTQAGGLAGAAGSVAPALPAAPSGWVPGTDVTRVVGELGSAPYAVPTFGAAPTVGDVSSVDVAELGGSFATGTGAPDTGVAEVDAMTEQVGVLDGTYDQLGGADLDAVFGSLGQGGLPALPTDEVTGDLTGGLLPGAPSADDGAIDPDEEGAQNALAFGYQLTDGVTGAFTTMDADAQSVLASHAELTATVDELAAETRSVQAQGAADVQGELAARTAAAEQARADAVAQLTAAHDAHAAAVQAAAADAQADVESTVADARAQLESEASAQADALADAAASAQSDAEKRKNDVDAKAQELLDRLDELEAEGAASADEAADAAAQVRAEAERVKATIDADAAAQSDAYLAAAEQLRAEGAAKLAAFDAAQSDLPDVQAEADALVAQAGRDLAFNSAVADARRDLSIDAHQAAAEAALADMEARADAHVEAVRASAMEYLDAADDYAESGKGLVAQVQSDGDAYATTAVDYVLDVAEDYDAVAAPERAEAAERLRGEAATLDTIADGAVASGAQVDGSFDAIVSAGESLRAQIEAMAL